MSTKASRIRLKIHLSGQTSDILVDPNILVMDIGDDHGFPWPQHHLMLSNGTSLPIHKRIIDCNIRPHDIIQVIVSFSTSSFYVELPDTTIKQTYPFKQSDTIFAIKRSLKLNPKDNEFYLNGTKLHNEQTIDECNIFRSCLIQCCYINTKPSYTKQWKEWDKAHPQLSSKQHWIISNINESAAIINNRTQHQLKGVPKQDDEDEKETKAQWKDVSDEWIPFMDIPRYEFNLKYPNDITKWDNIIKERELKINKLLTKLKLFTCEYNINANGSVTFYPSPFLGKNDLGTDILSTKAFIKSKQYQNIMMEMKCDSDNLEAVFDKNSQIIQSPHDLHAFIVAIELAYFMHYPLKISPSHIWLLILQSIGMHIDENAEKLRSKYVIHQGKQILSVNRPDFVKGDPNNKWEEVIQQFVQQIDQNTVSDTVELLECDFSSTSVAEMIACKISIMELMKHYFEYGLRGGCGFMQITLDGTKQDWINLKNKLKILLTERVDKRFGDKWGSALLPIIDRFIDVYNGNIDCLFWNSMVRRGAISGSFGMCGLDNIDKRGDVFYSGWFNVFFPLLNARGMKGLGRLEQGEMDENKDCVAYSDEEEYVKLGLDGYGEGPKMELFPSGLCAAPLKYTDLADNGKEYNMKLIAGFVGVYQCESTLEIVPMIGWMVGNEKVYRSDALKCEQMYAAEYEWPCPLCSYLNAMTFSCAMCGCPKDAQ